MCFQLEDVSLSLFLFFLLLSFEIISDLTIDFDFFLAESDVLDRLYLFESLLSFQVFLLGFVLRNCHDHFFAVSGFDSAEGFIIGKRFAGAAHAVLQHADTLELLGFQIGRAHV